MQTFVQDLQLVGETSAVLFTTVQQGAVSASVILQNRGTNTINYDFQQFNGAAWVDIGPLGSPTQNTISPGQVLQIQLNSAYAQVQLIGYASGGSTLDFSLQRYFNRLSGGNVPLVSY